MELVVPLAGPRDYRCWTCDPEIVVRGVGFYISLDVFIDDWSTAGDTIAMESSSELGSFHYLARSRRFGAWVVGFFEDRLCWCGRHHEGLWWLPMVDVITW